LDIRTEADQGGIQFGRIKCCAELLLFFVIGGLEGADALLDFLVLRLVLLRDVDAFLIRQLLVVPQRNAQGLELLDDLEGEFGRRFIVAAVIMDFFNLATLGYQMAGVDCFLPPGKSTTPGSKV
jgi:hypothetical protein